LTVPAWHDIPGSKLKARDFVRSVIDLLAIWRGRRVAEAGRASQPPGQTARRG
jgi:uncharacterized membrane protein